MLNFTDTLAFSATAVAPSAGEKSEASNMRGKVREGFTVIVGNIVRDGSVSAEALLLVL
jgi:hypothetical protein